MDQHIWKSNGDPLRGFFPFTIEDHQSTFDPSLILSPDWVTSPFLPSSLTTLCTQDWSFLWRRCISISQQHREGRKDHISTLIMLGMHAIRRSSSASRSIFCSISRRHISGVKVYESAEKAVADIKDGSKLYVCMTETLIDQVQYALYFTLPLG